MRSAAPGFHCTVEPRFGVAQVNIRAILFDIAEDRRRPDIEHRSGGGNEDERGDQHFLAWADPGGNQGKMQSRRPGVDANRIRNAEILSGCLLKAFYEEPEAEGALFKQLVDIGEDVGFDLPPLKRQIGERSAQIRVPAER